MNLITLIYILIVLGSTVKACNILIALYNRQTFVVVSFVQAIVLREFNETLISVYLANKILKITSHDCDYLKPGNAQRGE